MFNFLFFPSLLSNYFLTFGITKYFRIPSEISISVSILTNSFIISSSSFLYLNNYLSYDGMNNAFQYPLAYFMNDLWFRYQIGYHRDYKIKVIHHIISTMGIYKFPIVGNLIPLLYLTELTNIPFETRNILKKIKYNKCYIQEILIFILYFSYGYFRIYKQYNFIFQNFRNLNLTYIDTIALVGIYILWVYWYLLLNSKIYQVIKKNMVDKLSNSISKYLKNFLGPIRGSP